VQRRGGNKLRSKYYGSFEVIERIGKVSYRLNLPEGSQVHPVFHVSQLKERVGTGVSVSVDLPVVGNHIKMRSEPVAILDRRIVKGKNEPIA
jgi:hypothetical protein